MNLLRRLNVLYGSLAAGSLLLGRPPLRQPNVVVGA